MKKLFKNSTPHIFAIILFLVVSYIYFFPALEGKVLQGTDNYTAKGMQGEIMAYTSLTGDYPAWTNGAFGGMPAYTIWMKKDAPLQIIENVIHVFAKRGPVSYLFIAMVSFYILLLCYGVNPWLSIAGSFAYAFSGYFIVIIGAGHITKVISLAYMPGVIAGIYLAYRKNKILLGAAIMALFLALEISPAHYQIIYYTILLVLGMGINYLVVAIKNKTLVQFVKTTSVLFIAAVLAGLTNISSVWTTQEYTPYSARGEKFLTENKEGGTVKVKNEGLDFDYATMWSYGISESLNLFIPNFKGGSSAGPLSENSEVYKLFSKRDRNQAKQIIKQMPLYWGDQPSTEGPQYMGALALFLFVFALFFVRSKEKWWILAISVFALMLAWGNNFETFNRFIFHYFPLYNKFRAVSTTLVIVQFLIPFWGIVAINQLLTDYDRKEFIRSLKWALGITGGIALLFVLLPGVAGSFSGPADARYADNQPFLDALMADRKTLLRNDAIRSLLFVLAGAGVLLGYHLKKLNGKVLYASLAILMILDLGIVGTRFISHDDFKTVRTSNTAFIPSKADISVFSMEMRNPEVKEKVEKFRADYPNIEKRQSPELTALNMTTDYRVLNISEGINFSDALTSFYHKSLSGYSPVKLRRYQDLMDRGVLVKEIQNFVGKMQNKPNAGSTNVLNMLNTKYVIYNKEQPAYLNPNALGNAWFVKNIEWVDNADTEFETMQKVNPRNEVVVHNEFKSQGLEFSGYDSTAVIRLVDYKPNHLGYSSVTNTDMLGVFSEMYYPAGWNVYVDNKKVDYFRANYFLRGLKVPQGEHKIEFRFEPKSYVLGNEIGKWSSVILIITMVVMLGFYVKNSIKASTTD